MRGKRYRTLSLRAAMLLLTIACIAAAVYANALRDQAELIARIRTSGGSVTFRSEWAPDQRGRLAKLFGEDAAGDVFFVHLPLQTPPELREEVKQRGWTNVDIYLCPSHPPEQSSKPSS